MLINTLLPWFGYLKPLSTLPLVLFFSLAIAILGFGAYWRNRDSTRSIFSPELGGDIKNKHLWLLLFPLLFPLLVVIGRRVMDTGGSNVILVGTFLLILLYVILVMWQNKKMPTAAYPIAIGMISLTLLLARGMMSNYLIGDDIYAEYHAFLIVSQNLHWSVAAWPTNVTASLSVSLLPAILQSILKINPLYIYKVVLLLPISLVPVIGYIIYKKYVGSFYGFLSSFFFVAQLPFIYLLSEQIRLGMALISFSLAIMVLFDDHISGLKKKILFLVFLFSTVVEYYVLPIIFLGLLFALWLVPKISKGSLGSQPISAISGIFLPSILIFLWWGQLTATAFTYYVFFSKEVLTNLSTILSEEFQGGVDILYTLPSFSLAMQVPGIIQRIVFVVVGIGVVSMLMRKELRVKFSGYAILSAACLTLLVAIIVLPYVSIGYSSTRLYLQVLVILAPAFIAGCQAIFDGIGLVWAYFARLSTRFTARGYRPQYRLPRFSLLAIFIGVILVGQFFSASALYHTLFGVPGREILDKKSQAQGVFYEYDSEVLAADWLGTNNVEKLSVYLGSMSRTGGNVFEFTDHAINGEFAVQYFTESPPPHQIAMYS